MTMTKFFLILGVASITYGFARWQILTEVSTKQNAYFEGFFAVHSDDSTARVTKQEVGQLRKQVMLSGGMHHGWAQAVIPVTFGLMFLATGYFF
jgi:hypothetical protein